MRYYCWILVVFLLSIQSAHALDFFGSFLHWQTTEPVDWVLNTNRLPADQFVAYKTITFDSASGFRVGVRKKGDWDTEFYYSRIYVSSSHSESGNLTPAFMGGKLALSDEPKSTLPYFDHGQVETAIDYNVLDWNFGKGDLGKSFGRYEPLRVRPVIGLRAAWINQTFDSGFGGDWPADNLSKNVTEHIENNFWGIGPKIGIENAWNAYRGENCHISCIANFYAAYLLGQWTIRDETRLTSIYNSNPSTSTRVIPIDARDFGGVTFQAIVGIEVNYGCWTAMAGYELNDWLNQCQIFDDATGPHNNDLVLQGLTLNIGCSF